MELNELSVKMLKLERTRCLQVLASYGAITHCRKELEIKERMVVLSVKDSESNLFE